MVGQEPILASLKPMEGIDGQGFFIPYNITCTNSVQVRCGHPHPWLKILDIDYRQCVVDSFLRPNTEYYLKARISKYIIIFGIQDFTNTK